MKFLLTSAGIKNPSIHDALVDLLGKPIAECSALCIPTAAYGHPLNPRVGWRFISGNSDQPMTELGWKSVGVLELTALPSIDRQNWVPLVQETDVLLVSGGDALYLATGCGSPGWPTSCRRCDDTVWVGFSAGSMALTPRIGEDFVFWKPPPAATKRWESSTSRSSRTWTTSTCRRTRWPRQNNGRRDSESGICNRR